MSATITSDRPLLSLPKRVRIFCWGLSFLTLVGLFLVNALIYSNDSLDDPYITYRYAHNFARGEGLTWNVGERPVEGYTTFLWVIINGFAIKAGLHPLFVSKLLSLFFGLLLLALIYSPFNKTVCSLTWRFALGVLIALCPVLQFYGQSGMETLFFSVLVFAGVLFWSGSRGADTRLTSLVFASFFLSIATLTRPEGLLVFTVVLAIEFFTLQQEQDRRLRRITAFLLPYLIICLPFFLWRLHYYGFLFPNTYYAKHSGNRLNNLPLGLLYLGNAFAPYLAVPLSVIAGVIIGGQKSVVTLEVEDQEWTLQQRAVMPLLLIPVAYAGYIFWVGGDDTAAFPSVRLLAPTLPICWLIPIAVGENLTWKASQSRNAITASVIVVLCILAWSADGLLLLKKSNNSLQSSVSPVAFLKAVPQKMRSLNTEHPGDLAAWIRSQTKPDDLVAVPWAGRVPYYADRPVLDMLGLNDIHIAHVAPVQRGIDVKMDPGYVLARRPKLIFVNVDASYWLGKSTFEEAGGWKIGDKQLLELLQRSTNYELVRTAPTSGCVFRRKD